jgi:hypothetical protein
MPSTLLLELKRLADNELINIEDRTIETKKLS